MRTGIMSQNAELSSRNVHFDPLREEGPIRLVAESKDTEEVD